MQDFDAIVIGLGGMGSATDEGPDRALNSLEHVIRRT